MAAGTVTASVAPWFAPLAQALAGDPARKRSCILLWMNGGPSQIDTFDLKPGHANGGPFKPRSQTAVPGLQISEHLPKLAKFDEPPGRHPLDDHQGRRPRPGHLPTCAPATGRKGPSSTRRSGSLVAKELDAERPTCRTFVSIAP